ncbi:hypothetical protein HZA87_00555 [Candidatus Uhrbacteria bacterium]|nr:hypothetical protein [Candidatus Uhrbacteria bacterium]
MPPTNPTNPTGPDVDVDQSLSQDDPEVRARSTEQLWRLMGVRMTGFEMDELTTIPRVQVAERIATYIGQARGRMSGPDIAAITTGVNQQYDRELANSAAESQRQTLAPATTTPGRQQADVWLRTIFKYMEASDIRSVIQATVPHAIRVTDINNPDTWTSVTPVAIPPGGTNMYGISVNLSLDVWRRGDVATIRRQLLTQPAATMGVTITPVPPAPAPATILTDDFVDGVLNSRDQVVEMFRPQDIHNFPLTAWAGVEVSIDMRRMIQRRPQIASMDREAFITYLLSPNVTDFQDCFRFRDAAPPNPPMANPGPGSVRLIVEDVFATPGMSIAPNLVSLTEALNNRAPVQRILNSSADNRSMMLALETIRNHPGAEAALGSGAAELASAQQAVQTIDNLLALDTSVRGIESGAAPEFTHAEAVDGVGIMDTIIDNADVGKTQPDGTTVAIDATLTPAQVAIAQAVGIRRWSIVRENHAGGGGAWRDNSNEFDNVRTAALTARANFETARRRVEEIERSLQRMITAFETHATPILPVQLGAYPALLALIQSPTPPPPFGVQRNAITRTMNYPTVCSQFRSALLIVGSVSMANLDGRKKEADERFLRATTAQSTVVTSDDCWNVVRRGMEMEGRHSPQEIDDIIRYMKRRGAHTPKTERDLATYDERDKIPEYELQTDAQGTKTYNKDKTYGRPSNAVKGALIGGATATAGVVGSSLLYGAGATALLASPFGAGLVVSGALAYGAYHALNHSYDAWADYKRGLFRSGYIGMTLEAGTNAAGQFSIEQLTDAYYKTKYLLGEGENVPDELRIPPCAEVDNFLRSIRRAILEKSQETDSLTTAEKQRLGITDNMNASERIAAARASLIQGQKPYFEANKGTITKMAEKAFEPVKKKMEWEKALWENMNPVGEFKWNRPITYGRGLLYNLVAKTILWNGIAKTGYAIGSGIVSGGANVVASQAKAVSENKLGAAAGAGLLTWAAAGIVTPWLAVPAGIIIGANYLRKQAAANHGAAHEGSHA